jgi:hypothetical protein
MDGIPKLLIIGVMSACAALRDMCAEDGLGLLERGPRS